MNVSPPTCWMLAALLALAASPAFASRLGFEASFKGQPSGLDAKLSQVVVTKVANASPAEHAGLRPGDVIDQVNGQAVNGSSSRGFYKTLSRVKPGEHLVLTVLRAGQRLTLDLTAAADT